MCPFLVLSLVGKDFDSTKFTGNDSFSYEVCDGGIPNLCDTALVFITVLNLAPLAVADTFVINSGTNLNANCILNDTDPEGGTLAMSTLPVINVTHGSLTLNNNGTFNYVPLSGFTGTDFFFYTVCDNGANPLCSNAKVLITSLNRAPLAFNDTAYVVSGKSVSGNAAINDVDAEGGTLITSILAQTQHGTIVLQSNGVFEYTSQNGFTGIDTFTYELCDDGTPTFCDTASVLIYVSESESDFSIPNAFSPNGDNVNDVFEIRGISNFPDNEIQVFDRNGLLVYSVIGYRNTWTGLDKKGKELAQGSYFYILDKKDGNSAVTGFIVISR